MPTFIERLTMGINGFIRSYAEPYGADVSETTLDWNSRYRLLWHYYNNSIFDNLAEWKSYLSTNRLYRHTRGIYNPARRLVDFYAGTVYPGMLTYDASQLPDGTPIAIPFTERTSAKLRMAMGQIWKWSNWQANKAVMVRYGACTGDVLVEIIDNPSIGKVYLNVRWPGLVTYLNLDDLGNVKEYHLQYQYSDMENPNNPRTRTYRKEVTETSIKTFRDDAPYSFDGIPATIPNEYGFVPAVWVKHLDVGGKHGAPAMRNMNKWDELNGLASHALDNTHRVMESPILVTGDNITAWQNQEQAKDTSTSKMREEIPIIRGPVGSNILSVSPPEGENLAHIEQILTEIEKDHPELTMWSDLRKMSQVTGPGVSRLFGDVEIYVSDAKATYDTQMIKLMQMSVAIAGWRSSNGDWGKEMTPDQQKFLDYNLESYDKGDLDFEIGPRPIIPLGTWETVQVERAQVALEKERNDVDGAAEGDMVSQISQRLRMKSSTEGALQTSSSPTG
jgi:hypothetical protein